MKNVELQADVATSGVHPITGSPDRPIISLPGSPALRRDSCLTKRAISGIVILNFEGDQRGIGQAQVSRAAAAVDQGARPTTLPPPARCIESSRAWKGRW